MMLIVGTVPIADMPLLLGVAESKGEWLSVQGQRIPCAQGTAAMVSAALAVTDHFKLEPPHCLLIGDTGAERRSRVLYEELIKSLARLAPEVLALHYWLPIMGLTHRLSEAIARLPRRPLLVADAGSMYAAKAAGLAPEFDIFTPDAAEMAFLADPDAVHPAYISRHLFETDVARTPELIKAAYKHGGAARLLLVKGAVDYVVKQGKVVATVAEPDVPALEAIGGTGDTITGLVAALAYAGLDLEEAATIAARANRMAGKLAAPTPATRVHQIIARFPEVFRECLGQWSGPGLSQGESHDRS